jgi:hypothetical protein
MRRTIWVSVTAVTLLAIATPARTEPGDVPKHHVAGIGSSASDGGPGVATPRLVRPGSDRRAAVATAVDAAEATGGPLAPVVTPPTFDGIADVLGRSPADPTGAVGVTYHLAAVNAHMRFFARTGAVFGPQRRLRSLDPELPGTARDFDPRASYDPYGLQHHFVLAFASTTSTRSFLSIVVIPEGHEDTTTDWCTLHMSGDQVAGNGKQVADYPMIGFTKDRVTITTNQFDYSKAPKVGAFRYAQVISMRKSHLYDCSVQTVPIKVFGRTQTRDPDGSAAFTIAPATSIGGAPATQFMTSLDVDGSIGKLILWQLRMVNGRLRLSRVQVTRGTIGMPPWGRQCGNAKGLDTKWDTGDLRVTSTFWDPVRGRLYAATATAGNVGGGAVASVIRWWEIDPASPLGNSTVTRRANIGADGRDLAWPSIATDGDGNIWVTYARAGSSECLAAYASVVRPGVPGSSPVLLQAGDGRYEVRTGTFERWGDYTAIGRDPSDPTQMATYGAYPLDDGVGGSETDTWQQVIATVTDDA